MPIRLAARKCPDAVFLPTDMPAYVAASARVMATLRAFPVRLEMWGLDEGFVGGDIDDPQQLATDLRVSVLDEVGLTCAIGIGRNKNQAKIAARFAKKDPSGTATLTDETWMPAMGARPVGDLWGVGPKTVKGSPEYGAAKAGLIRFTASLAGLASTHGIRMMCVAPDWIGLSRARNQWQRMTADERAASPALIPPAELVALVLGLIEDGTGGTVVELWGGDRPVIHAPG